MRPLRIRRCATIIAAIMLGISTALVTATPANADPLVVCTDIELEVYVDEDEGYYVTVSGTVAGCIAPGHPDIHSGTMSGSGFTTVFTSVLIVVQTNDTITWNTGETTTITDTREFAGLTTVAGAGEGATVLGLFHPSAWEEAGTGTRTSSPTGTALFMSSV